MGPRSRRFQSALAVALLASVAVQGRAQSATTVASKAENGTLMLLSRVIVENLGGVDAPGPVQLFIDSQDPEVGIVGGWNGISKAPVAAGGTIQVDGRSPMQGSRPFDRDRLTNKVQVIALCPDGSSGELSDGHREDNVQTLRQAGAPASTAP